MRRRLSAWLVVLLILLPWFLPNLGTAVAGDGPENIYRTPIQGSQTDPLFMDTAPEGGLLVGIDIGLGKFGGNDVITSARPIYLLKNEEVLGKQYGTDTGRVVRAIAKPGYAVAGLTTKAGLVLDGMSVTFMKVDDLGRLNPRDSNQTVWVGGQGGKAPVRVAGTGARVVGIIGRANKSNVTGLGLLIQLEVKAPATKPGETTTRAPNPVAAPAGSSKLTRENFDRVQNGMTEDQVREILGPPGGSSDNTVTTNASTTRTKTFTWRQVNPTLTVTVTIRNEKVSGKNWQQITPLIP
jgi:hypothetical protein